MNISNTNLKYNKAITLQYQGSEKVIITNFPNLNTPTYNPKGNEESFKITPTGLVNYTPPISNEIIFANSTKKEIIKIAFNISEKKLIAISNTNIALNPYPFDSYDDAVVIRPTSPPPQAVFLLRLRNSTGTTIKVSSIINSNETAKTFETEINNQTFEIGDILEIYSLNEPKTTITHFPSRGIISPLTGDKIGNGIRSFFKITQNGLQSYNPTSELFYPRLLNDIIVKANDNTVVGLMQFDTIHNMFYFVGFNPTQSSTFDYSASIIIFDTASSRFDPAITRGVLAGKASIPIWVAQLNFVKFNFNYKFVVNKLTYPPNSNLITISNFLTPGNIYNPRVGDDILITNKGLQKLASPTPQPGNTSQKILIGNKPLISTVEINNTNQTLMVTNTRYSFLPLFSPTAVFLFKLRDSSGQNIKISSIIKAGENGAQFARTLNNQNFVFGDILELRAYHADDNYIANFPVVGQSHLIGNNLLTGDDIHELFILTDQGLQPYTAPSNFQIPKLLTDIIIKKSDGSSFLTISFDSESKAFLVISNAKGPYSASSQPFKVITFTQVGGAISTLNSVDDVFVFAQNLRLRLFDFDDTLILNFTDSSRNFISITNMPSQGQSYTPTSNREVFLIKQTGLVKI